MDVHKYLERINYSGDINISVPVLKQLQEAHLLSVPFENLDIHSNRQIKLESSYEKIVDNHRGGFCYELNGLFHDLLIEIGYDARLISARVWNNNTFGPEFDHMAIIVTIHNDEYLVDVGFGAFTFWPLKMELNIPLQDPCGDFIFEKFDDQYLVVKKKQDRGFSPEYLFTTTKRTIHDFSYMCQYHQTNSHSHFTKKIICSLLTINGRVTVSGNILKIREGELVTETKLNKDEIKGVLYDYFKIKG